MKFAHVRVANISHLQCKYFTAKRFHLPEWANFVGAPAIKQVPQGSLFFFWLGSGPTFGIDIWLIAGVSGIVGDIVPAVFASALALVTLVIRAAAEARGYGKDNERENK